MRISDWSSDVCSSDLAGPKAGGGPQITIEPWDYRYYAEKVRKAKYDLDESEVKPYLQLDKLVDAMFWSAGQLYDLGFRENRSEERRVGKEWVRTCRSWGSPFH